MSGLNLRNYKGIAIYSSDTSFESSKIQIYCKMNDIPCIRVKPNDIFPEDYVPTGSVEWGLQLLGTEVKPDYYPRGLESTFYRNIWETNEWPFEKVFIKPSDRYKRFDGKITKGTYSGKKKGPYWCSDIVSFTNEWRYYVADGEVLCGEWYQGDGINTPEAPELDIDIPSDYCGCLDFGTFPDGTLALVEAQHPFACGWYGRDDKLYIQWLIAGWDYMKRNK